VDEGAREAPPRTAVTVPVAHEHDAEMRPVSRHDGQQRDVDGERWPWVALQVRLGGGGSHGANLAQRRAFFCYG